MSVYKYNVFCKELNKVVYGKDINCNECENSSLCNLSIGIPKCENCKYNDAKKHLDICMKCTAIALQPVCMFEPKEGILR